MPARESVEADNTQGLFGVCSGVGNFRRLRNRHSNPAALAREEYDTHGHVVSRYIRDMQ